MSASPKDVTFLGDFFVLVEYPSSAFMEERMKSEITQGYIEQQIFLIRGRKVMISTYLARLYGVEPKRLVVAVKRNKNRFPRDFMFPLTRKEFTNLKSQFGVGSINSVDKRLYNASFSL